MRDPDDIQAYEARQQRLVEGILDSIHAYTREDSRYRETFGKAAVSLLEILTFRVNYVPNSQAVRHIIEDLIKNPVDEFLDAEHKSNGNKRRVEYHYLLFKVFEKVLESVSSGILGAYHAEELKRDYSRTK